MTKPLNPGQRLSALAHGYWAAAALHAAVRTGITAELARGPATIQELADRLSLSPRGLEPLLISLATVKVLAREGEAFALEPSIKPLLTPGGNRDMSNMVLHMADMMADWAKLDQCVASGKPVERPKPAPGQEPPQRTHFYRAMRDIARQMASGLAGRLGLQPGQRLLDLGGGPGVYGLTFAQETPGLHCTVFDLPAAQEHFLAEKKGRAGAEDVRFLAGDYREDPLGGPYEVVWISQVLHGAGPEVCQELLDKAAGALAPGGLLWVQEFVVDPAGKGHPFAALFSLNMLVNTPDGKGYTLAEMAAMLTAAGLEEVEDLGPTQEGDPARLTRARKPL